MGELNLVVTTKVTTGLHFKINLSNNNSIYFLKHGYRSKERQILDFEFELCNASYIAFYSCR